MSEGLDRRYRAARDRGPPPGGLARARRVRARRRCDDERPHLYIKPSAPFTSGNVHIGHVRSYSIGDAYARFRRARGDDVLFAFGFDAFGLPAELGAIAGGEPPSDWVDRCADAHDRPARAARLLLRLGALVPQLRRDHVPLVAVAVPDAARGRPDLPRHRQRRLVRHLPDDARLDPGRGRRHLLALPRPGAPDRAAAVVPADQRLRRRRTTAAWPSCEASGIWDEVALASQRIVLGRVDGVEVDLRGRRRHAR